MIRHKPSISGSVFTSKKWVEVPKNNGKKQSEASGYGNGESKEIQLTSTSSTTALMLDNKKNDDVTIPLLSVNTDNSTVPSAQPSPTAPLSHKTSFVETSTADPSAENYVGPPLSSLYLDYVSLIIFFFQVHSLLYMMGYSMTGVEFRNDWSFTLLFSLDIASFSVQSDGPRFNSLVNIYIITLLPFGIILAYFLLNRFVFSTRARMLRISFLHPLYLSYTTLSALEFMYIPALSLCVRLFQCSSENNNLLMFSQPYVPEMAVECYSIDHLWILITSLPILAVFLVWLPLSEFFTTRSLILFNADDIHEDHLVHKELEMLLGLNNFYHKRQMFLLAPYRRPFAYFRVYACLWKIVAVALTIAWSQWSSSLLIESSLVLALFVATILIRPYRVQFTNYFLRTISVSLMISSIFNLLKASKWESSFLMADSFAVIMLAIPIITIGILVGIIAVGMLFSIKWPVEPTDVALLKESDGEFVDVLVQSKKMIEESPDWNEESFPAKSVREMINRVSYFANKPIDILTEQVPIPQTKNEREDSSKNSKNHKLIKILKHIFAATDDPTWIYNQYIMAGHRKAAILKWSLIDYAEELALLYNAWMDRRIELGYTEDDEIEEESNSNMEASATLNPSSLNEYWKNRLVKGMKKQKVEILDRLLVVYALTKGEKLIPWNGPVEHDPQRAKPLSKT